MRRFAAMPCNSREHCISTDFEAAVDAKIEEPSSKRVEKKNEKSTKDATKVKGVDSCDGAIV